MGKLVIGYVSDISLEKIIHRPGVEGQMFLADSGRCYIFRNNCWIQISDNFTKPDYKQELIPLICKQCGAPLKSDNKTGRVKCEYCDTEYWIS